MFSFLMSNLKEGNVIMSFITLCGTPVPRVHCILYSLCDFDRPYPETRIKQIVEKNNLHSYCCDGSSIFGACAHNA
jgi:hypothetical protein